MLAWVASGLAAGWVTGYALRGEGYGLIGNLLIGLSGGIVGGWVFGALGVSPGVSMMIHVPIALSGGVALVAAVRAVDRSARRAAAFAGFAPAATGASELERQIQRLGDIERRVVTRFVHRAPVARDLALTGSEDLTTGERVADRVAAIGGSWPFLAIFGAALTFWIVVNVGSRLTFDPYPFILLNLVLSCLAAVQAPVIMMSQRRQAAKDRADAQHDFEINLKAELEILALHEKLDATRTQELSSLLSQQEQQLLLLSEIAGVVRRPTK